MYVNEQAVAIKAVKILRSLRLLALHLLHLGITRFMSAREVF